MKSSSLAFSVAVVALLIGGGLYLYDQKVAIDRSKIFDESNPVSGLGSDGADSSLPAPAKIDLKPLSGSEASGTSSRVFSSGEFILTINADLPELPSDNFYNGFLSKSGGDKTDQINLGKIENDNGSYYLEYKNAKDMSDYNIVSVTAKSTTDPGLMNNILEGQF